MARDLSSSCTEINEIVNDEKEEGEISLEDVSSSEESQPFKYHSRAVKQCLYCLSTQHCATWCRSLTINKNNVKRDAGLQGKENRSNQRYFNDTSSCLSQDSTATAITKNNGLYSTLQEKNDDENNDLVPISSDSDMDLVGLGHDPKTVKKSHRHETDRKPNKIRKKRRKKSPSLSLSLSPSSVDLSLSVKESIHRVEPKPVVKKESIHKCHHRSSEKNKAQVPPSRSRPSAPRIRVLSRKRARTPLPRKSSSLLRQRKVPSNKNTSNIVKSSTPLQQSPTSCGNVTKLLKKVRKLEPFSSRRKEKGTSLKDKLSNIIKAKESTSSTTTNEEIPNIGKSVVEVVTKEETIVQVQEKESTDEKVEITKNIEKENKDEKVEITKNIEKEASVRMNADSSEEKNINEDDDDLIILRQLALETKHKKGMLLKSVEVKSEPQEQPLFQPPPPPESCPLPPPPPPPSPPPPLPSLPPPPPPPPSSPPPLPQESVLTSESKSEIVKLPTFCMDDNDEDLELRMIALRSAVLKKHRTRMQRGIKKKNLSSSPLPRIESPFTSSFLEDFPLLAEICSPTSPLNQKDIYSTEDMELDSDVEQEKNIEVSNELESPYSPSDDFSGVTVPIPTNILIEKEHDINLATNINLYKRSIETPITSSNTSTRNHLDNSSMEIVGQELRPYSPTDATIYDPDLPGVRSNKVEVVPPLQPPPLPPLTMFQQPMMLTCSTNLLNPFIDPSVQVLSTQTNNFAAIHSTVNPLLLSTTASASLFTYPTTSPISNLTMTAQPPVEQHSEQSTIEINTQLDEFGETDIDGSPLVQIEKDNQHHMPWPIINKPHYVQVPTDAPSSNLKKIPSLMEIDFTTSTIIQNTSPPSIKPLQKTKQKFNDLKTIKMTNSNFRPFKQRTSPKKLITKKSAAIFNNEEQLEEPPQETTQKGKRKLPLALQERTRKRKKSYTLKKSNNNSSMLTKSKENKFIEFNKELLEEDNKRRRISVDDDEEALREILLASLAKRSKGQQIPIANKGQISVNSQIKPIDENSKIDEQRNSLKKPELIKETSQTKVAPLNTIEKKLETKTLVTNQIKKSTAVSLSLSDHPLRKFIRKTSLPASTKVVNNAKRFQNLLNQRKLNQQKMSMIASSKSRFKVNNSKINHMNMQNQGSPQLSKKIQDSERIIFYLQDDTESESEEDNPVKSKLNSTDRPKLNIPTSEFEKSVDQFLKNVRLQQEMSIKENAAPSKTASPTDIKKSISPAVTLNKTPLVMIPPPTSSPKNASPTISNITNDSLKTNKTTSASATINVAKENNIANASKGLRIDVKIPRLSVTPQAVKHLPVSQQEEYRRLKQQILERERLKLQKSKESIATSTCVLTQSTPDKIVNTNVLSSPSLSSQSTKSMVTSYSVKSRELPTLIKTVPKTHLVATISPMSKQNGPDVAKTPLIHSTAKISNSTHNATQDNASTNKTIGVNNKAKQDNGSLSDVKAVTVLPKVSLLSSKQIVPDLHFKKQPQKMLEKMNDALSNHKMQISSMAQKVSSLRVLTKEQINKKTKQIQKMTNSDSRIVMDDLNKDIRKLQSSQSSVGALKKKEDTNKLNLFKKDCKNNLVNISTSNIVEQSSTLTVATKSNKSTQNWDEFKLGVNNEVESLSTLSTDMQKNLLRETEEKLIKKRHLVLDDITEMSSNLRQWEMEKDIQNLLIVEIKSLREQLKIAEKKLHKQKDKLRTIQPKVSNYHEKINNGRKECFRLSKICNSLGEKILGADYKVPTAGAELLNNRIKEVASHTQKLRNKRSQPTETINNINTTKTDKTISKNNSKSINHNIKINEYNENIRSQNKKTSKCTSQMVDNELKNPKILEPDTVISHNRNLNLNKINVHDNKFENEKIRINSDNSSINNENVNKKYNEPLIIPENNFQLIHGNSLNINLTTNNLTPEVENQFSEVNALNKIINTENVNSQTAKSLSNVVIVNTILKSENNVNVDQLRNNSKLDISSCIENRVKTNDKNNVSETKIIKKDLILKDNTELENYNDLMESDHQNLDLISQNDSENRKLFAENSVDIEILKTKNIELKNENCQRNCNRSSSDLISMNKSLNNETLSVQTNNKNLISTDEIIGNEFEKQPHRTTVNFENVKSESVKFSNKNSSLDRHSENCLTVNKNINVDSETQIGTNSNSENVSKESDNITENPECNCEIKNLNDPREEIVTIDLTKKSDMEKDKNSTSKIINDEHSTLSEEVQLFELANVNEVRESNQYSESTTTNKCTADTVGSTVNNDELPTNQGDSRMKKKVFQPYESILKHLKMPMTSQPHGILCPFEIMGTCNDGDCHFIHQTTSHCR